MTVQQAIEKLQKLPQDGQLMVADLEAGGSVPLQDFVLVDLQKADRPWIDVIFCEDFELTRYGLEEKPLQHLHD